MTFVAEKTPSNTLFQEVVGTSAYRILDEFGVVSHGHCALRCIIQPVCEAVKVSKTSAGKMCMLLATAPCGPVDVHIDDTFEIN